MFGSDTIVVILSLLGEGKIVPSNKNFLYEKFFELSKTFLEIFYGFNFNENKLYLECDMLNNAFNRIINNGMVEWRGLGEDNFIILPLLVKRGRELLMTSFSAVEIMQLNKAAEMFAKMIAPSPEKIKNCSKETCCGNC